MDRLVNKDGCGASVMLKGPNNTRIEHAVHFNFRVSNNEAEYEAFLAGMRIVTSLNLLEIEMFTDSQLVHNQVLGEFEVKDEKLIAYKDVERQELKKF